MKILQCSNGHSIFNQDAKAGLDFVLRYGAKLCSKCLYTKAVKEGTPLKNIDASFQMKEIDVRGSRADIEKSHL